MRTIKPGLAVSCLLGAGLATLSSALAEPIDMRTLYPQYLTAEATWQFGVAPTYSQSATATSLTIIGQPFQPNVLGTHNFTVYPLLDGDFTASVSVDLTPGAGGSSIPPRRQVMSASASRMASGSTEIMEPVWAT